MPAPTTHANARRAQNDAIRTLYEDTLVPVREIARIAGVTERNIYALVRRLGCRPRLRLASGGGRRIVPVGVSGEAFALDADGVTSALQRCKDAVSDIERLTAKARSAKDKHAAMQQGQRPAQTEASVSVLIVRTMRDLAAITDGDAACELKEKKAKPKRGRPYVWKRGLVNSDD